MAAQACCAGAEAAERPGEWLEPSLPAELESLRKQLESRVIGQERGIAQILACLARFRAGLSGVDRPAGAFLLLGPSGSGKTLTVEALAEVLHGSPKAVLKVHCGELCNEHELARLKGAPPGYVGWKECVPLLHEAKLREVRLRNAPALVLFDEVEKAHPALWDLLLGLLDKGEVVLNDNTSADFRETIVFLTGNAGAREIANQLSGAPGFRPTARRDTGAAARRASEEVFAPEFRNRLTATLTYCPLDHDQLLRIARLELDRLDARLSARHFLNLEVEPAAVAEIVEAGYDPEYGARYLKRAIERMVEEPVANLLAAGAVSAGDRLAVCAQTPGGPLLFRRLDEECYGQSHS